ncbi:Ig-like domain-containing protein [Antribacter gilvus]|uniref:Ig-like domain-containing protein n=1 Tax=Antribacter gilvus TaxID=2304675 RepID=UPI001F0B7A90|nr:Ig-like domain-containing protein [Antribacter gilvus]
MDVIGTMRERWRTMASIGVVTLFSGAVVGLAVAHDGQSTAVVDLNDSGVWVTKTSAGLLGRFNYEAQALDGTLLAGSPVFDVQQSGQRVLLTDAAASTASPVSAAHLTLDGTLRTAQGAQVASGGSTTAVLDPETGALWVVPFDGAASFDPESTEPAAEVGKGGTVAVSLDGMVFVAVPADSALYTVPTSSQGVPVGDVGTADLDVSPDAEVEVSAVGDDPVVLDRSASTLILPGGNRVEVQDGGSARLQQPSADSDVVVVATTSGLVSQPTGGGAATVRRAEGSPAAPVQLNGCTFGAWSSTAQVVRDCPGTGRDLDERLEGVSAGAQLTYRVNRDVIVLNDLTGGALWMAADLFEKVDDWDLKLPDDAEGEKQESEESTPEQVDQFVAERDQANRPPKPADDDFGVRPGRATVLPVLSNDVDPDGDVMTAAVAQAPAGPVVVDAVLGGAAVQATVPADATGTSSFTYEVTDGRGGSATASVALRVVPLTDNSPPAQTGQPVLRVGVGGTATIKVLPYFRDPDGDDLVLSTAAVSVAGDEVRARPDGTVEFRDGGTTTGRKLVDLTVTDSLGLVAEGRLVVDVVATQEPPVAVQDHVVALAGQVVTVEPLRNDHDPNGDRLRLVSVADRAPATITPHYAAGSFQFVSQQPGSYDITYQLSDGPNATMGLVRVDVVTPPEGGGAPVTVPDLVLLPAGGSALVDVLVNDTDPTGGVLVVQGVTVPDEAPVTVAVLAHQVLRVTETRRLDAPVVIGYTVSNGTATSTGQVRVVPIPAPDRLRPPDAAADEAVVHAGDVVTVPVLKNDGHPDGLALELGEELVEGPAAGDAFVSEGTVRFRAPAVAGTYFAVYEVRDPNGQKDSAQLTFHVTDGYENSMPQPPDLEARVLAGASVVIEVPLDGVDPDGDHVTLAGVGSAPELGTVEVVDGTLVYQAAPGAAGADTFTYRVVDYRGAPAVGSVRVGVAPPPANEPPLAVDDATFVRPGRTVGIDALANDSDPDGDEIAVTPAAFEGADALDPGVVDGLVVVTAPGAEGSYTFYYGIEDPYEARATGAITVEVADDAPLRRPVARDDEIPAGAVTSDTVTVAVLLNDVDPDGLASDLEVRADAEGVTVDGGQVTVLLGDAPRIVPYTVTDQDGLSATAYLRVPRDGSWPHLRDDLVPPEVVGGEPFTIELDEYVVVADGLTPRLTDEESVSALEGSHEVTGPTTIVYTPAKGYTGPAAVTFEVTDGMGPDDPDGRTALLTLPLVVVSAENLPPVFSGPAPLPVEPGEEGSIDLARYLTDPDDDPLTVEVAAGAEGLSPAVEGTSVRVRAQAGLTKGTTVTLPVTVSDGYHPPVAGEVVVTVVASTRPLARANDDAVPDAHQGEPVTVPVLDNDTNPFPDEPLQIVSSAVETGQGTAVTDGSEVTVTPSDSFVGVMVVRYRVQDATKDVDREVEGVLQVTVLGRPEAPAAPQVEEVRSRTVVLTWDPPNDNGAEITSYTVRSNDGYTKECATTTCTLDGLTNNVVYTFTVTATNDVGESDPSPVSPEARPDEKPGRPTPPTLEFGDSSLTVTWVNASYTDRSPIECVNLEISPAPADGKIQKSCVTGNRLVWDGLRNGTSYTVLVQAVNAAPDPSDWSVPSAPETPAAPPAQPAAPTATRVNTALGGQITVTWTAPEDNGDAVSSYHLTEFRDGSRVRTLVVTGTSQTIQNLQTGSSYSYTVQAENKAGKSPVSARSGEVVPYGTPDTPGTPTASLGGNTDGQAVVRWSPVAAAAFRGPAPYYQARANGSGARDASSPYTYTGLTNGTPYSFQVRACNAYTCSGWSGGSNEVTPYTTPSAPRVEWEQTSATQGRFVLRGPASSGGESVDRIEWSVSGTHSASGAATSWPSNVNVGDGYGQRFSISARACNAAGCGPADTASGSTNADPANREMWITRGADTSGVPGCNEGQSCARLVLHIRSWRPNTSFQMQCLSTQHDPNGQVYMPRWPDVWMDTALDGSALRTDAFGNYDGTTRCQHTYAGEYTWVHTNELGDSARLLWQ